MDYNTIIVEMLTRIQKLEQEVSILKSQFTQEPKYDDVPQSMLRADVTIGVPTVKPDSVGNGHDKTKYLYDGRFYGKNRLVLAVVQDYVAKNPNITCGQLQLTFNKSLQGSLGVVERAEVAQANCRDYYVRFFTQPNEVLHLSDGDMYVCTQWGILNIGRFLIQAKRLGFNIEEIK